MEQEMTVEESKAPDRAGSGLAEARLLMLADTMDEIVPLINAVMVKGYELTARLTLAADALRSAISSEAGPGGSD